MARRQTRGRVAKAQAAEDDDPIVNLYIAAIKLARRDLSHPVRSRESTNSNYPSASEQESAREFLAALYASATRRSDR